MRRRPPALKTRTVRREAIPTVARWGFRCDPAALVLPWREALIEVVCSWWISNTVPTAIMAWDCSWPMKFLCHQKASFHGKMANIMKKPAYIHMGNGESPGNSAAFRTTMIIQIHVKEFRWQETSSGDTQQTDGLFKGESAAISPNSCGVSEYKTPCL